MQPNSAPTALLEASVPTFRYNTVAVLDAIDLSAPEPGLIALLGPNGSGKSTLLKIIAGLLRTSQTTVRIRGESVSDPVGVYRSIGRCGVMSA